jgi:hypothetical protein
MNNEQKRAAYDKWIKVGLIGLGALVVSPIIFMVVKGILGLALAASIGLILVNVAPVISMKVANWKIKLIVAEARENPIETMVNLLAEKRKAFSVFKENVMTAATACKNFEQKAKQFALQYPARAQEFTVQVAAMQNLVNRKKIALQQAQEMLVHGDNKLDEMRAYWEISQAAQAANKAAGMDTSDMFEKLKADTAVDSVFESMNRAFADLEVTAALENNPSETMNLTTINTTSKVVA